MGNNKALMAAAPIKDLAQLVEQHGDRPAMVGSGRTPAAPTPPESHESSPGGAREDVVHVLPPTPERLQHDTRHPPRLTSAAMRGILGSSINRKEHS